MNLTDINRVPRNNCSIVWIKIHLWEGGLCVNDRSYARNNGIVLMARAHCSKFPIPRECKSPTTLQHYWWSPLRDSGMWISRAVHRIRLLGKRHIRPGKAVRPNNISLGHILGNNGNSRRPISDRQIPNDAPSVRKISQSHLVNVAGRAGHGLNGKHSRV